MLSSLVPMLARQRSAIAGTEDGAIGERAPALCRPRLGVSPATALG
jgi:hypothetical protein